MSQIIDVCLVDGQPLVLKEDADGDESGVHITVSFECAGPTHHYYQAENCDGEYQPTDEEAADRFGVLLKQAEARISKLRMALWDTQWGVVGVCCPVCGAGRKEGHTQGCSVGLALADKG